MIWLELGLGLVIWLVDKFYNTQGSKLAHVRKSETSKISGGLVKILGVTSPY
jgi:hypothetical protein